MRTVWSNKLGTWLPFTESQLYAARSVNEHDPLNRSCIYLLLTELDTSHSVREGDPFKWRVLGSCWPNWTLHIQWVRMPLVNDWAPDSHWQPDCNWTLPFQQMRMIHWTKYTLGSRWLNWVPPIRWKRMIHSKQFSTLFPLTEPDTAHSVNENDSIEWMSKLLPLSKLYLVLPIHWIRMILPNESCTWLSFQFCIGEFLFGKWE